MRKQEEKVNKENEVKHIKKVAPAKKAGQVKTGGASTANACTPAEHT